MKQFEQLAGKLLAGVQALPAWTDICSCNICISHIPVDYVGKGREHDCMDAGGRATQEQLPRSGSFACQHKRQK
jgi:hypothetical protein